MVVGYAFSNHFLKMFIGLMLVLFGAVAYFTGMADPAPVSAAFTSDIGEVVTPELLIGCMVVGVCLIGVALFLAKEEMCG